MKFDKFYAVVTNTDDPEKSGRIKVKAENLLSEDIEVPYWIEPRFHFVTKTGGFFGVPEVGSLVEIEMPVSTSNDELPDISSLTPSEVRYVCTAYTDIQTLHKIFSTNYPQRIGWAFPGGWVIYVDTKDGSIFMGYLGTGTTPKSWIKVEADKMTIETDQGVRIKLEPSQVLVEADSVPINLVSPNVKIGGTAASEAIALGNKLVTYFGTKKIWDDAHVHTSAAPGSPSSPPTVPSPAVPGDLLSTKHTVEP